MAIRIRNAVAASATLAACLAAQEPAARSAAERLADVQRRFVADMQKFEEAYKAAKTDEEREKAAAVYPSPDAYAEDVLAIVRQFPKDEAALDAAIWFFDAVGARNGAVSDVLSCAFEHHLDSPKLAILCRSMIYGGPDDAVRFLRKAKDESPHHEVQGWARYALAKSLLRASSESEEAEKLLEDLSARFDDVKSYRGTLARAAKADLFEYRNLRVGKVAPEIEGKDADGAVFKLSDYRGKVIFLDFWGYW
ncbi:MAG: hypothetical protein Fur0037_23020 [Planctomycetota bacterium]